MAREEKELIYNNLTMEEAVEQLHKHRIKILDEFCKAFLAENQLFPSEIELVQYEEKEGTTIKTVSYFRKKASQTV